LKLQCLNVYKHTSERSNLLHTNLKGFLMRWDWISQLLDGQRHQLRSKVGKLGIPESRLCNLAG